MTIHRIKKILNPKIINKLKKKSNKGTKNRQNKENSKIADSNFTKSMSTQNIPAKSQRLSERVRKLDPIVYCLRDTFRNKYIKRKPME